MTLNEFLRCPRTMSFEEYDKLLKEKKTVEKMIGATQGKIYDEIDSLEILADEEGSDRYQKHYTALMKHEARMEKLMHRFEEIRRIIEAE